jgi:hypothetical protein
MSQHILQAKPREGFRSSGTWHVLGWVVSYVSEEQCQFLDCLTLEDVGTMLVWNFGNHLQSDTVSHPRRLESSASSLWDLYLWIQTS